MTADLCATCGYWVATDGPLCESCAHGDPFPGLEAHICGGGDLRGARVS